MPLGDLYNREEWGPGSNIADNIANRYAQDEKERLTPPASIRKPEASAIPLGGEASAENPFIMAKDQEKKTPSLIVREAPEKITPPAEQKNPANPEAIGVEAPNPLESPAGAIAATQHNLQNGVGRQGIITPPQQPDYAAILKQMETVESKRVVFDANKAPDWQNSQALTFGLLSFGMNLMAGNDAATAFNQAGATFNELYGREKRQAWANDLRAQGYDEHEIQAYVESGDHKALTDPAEKQARAVERRKAQLGLLRAEYEASPEYVQYQQQVEAQKAAREAGKYEMDVANHEDTKYDRAERLRMAQEKHVQDMKESEARLSGENAKFSAELSKSENQYVRAEQGMRNYNATVSKIQPKYGAKGVVGNMLDAAVIEAVFSGNQLSETAMRSLNPDTVELINAEREFLAPLLRKDSGAAISKTEWKTTGEIYFPRPGESKERIAQKAQAREIALAAMEPNAPKSIKDAVFRYTHGQNEGLRRVGGETFEKRGGQWHRIER